MKIALRSALLLFVFCLSTSALLPRASAEEPRVGKHHPALRLPTIDGQETIDLRALAGKKVLLIQFASW